MEMRFIRSWLDVHFMTGAILRAWTTTPTQSPEQAERAMPYLETRATLNVSKLVDHLRYIFGENDGHVIERVQSSVVTREQCTPSEIKLALCDVDPVSQIYMRLREPNPGIIMLPEAKGDKRNG